MRVPVLSTTPGSEYYSRYWPSRPTILLLQFNSNRAHYPLFQCKANTSASLPRCATGRTPCTLRSTLIRNVSQYSISSSSSSNPSLFPVEAIILKGRNSKNEYEIPDNILAPPEDTRQQLNMIERVLTKNLGKLPSSAKKDSSPSHSVATPKGSSQATAKANTPGASTSGATPKRPHPGSSRVDSFFKQNTPKTAKKEDKKPPTSGDVTVVLDSDDDEQYNADLATAIELSKRPKLDSPKKKNETVVVVKKEGEKKWIAKPKSLLKETEPKTPKKEEEKKPIDKKKSLLKETEGKKETKSPAPEATKDPSLVGKVTAKAIDKLLAEKVPPRTPAKGTWLNAKPSTSQPTASASSSSTTSTPTTTRRPVAFSSSTTSKLESKPKVNEGPRLVPNDLSVERRIEDYIEVVYPKGEAIKKYEASHPYNFFLTAIPSSKPTHKETLSMTMQEILDLSLGDLDSSVQINYMVDIGWLLAHYYFAGHE